MAQPFDIDIYHEVKYKKWQIFHGSVILSYEDYLMYEHYSLG